ncbi:SufD family Fe-S cluster assembly protein [Bombilactobacillus bombi]|uniref:SufD family Fe-S cluster assembly protein n=1 Tax=Bombilactobacillus bombi TaxID=1303590 RepID=UPI0015E610BC|nr:SufD family Fe-S cluster assembly protein [Bombilactobacillus bombi]
MNELQTLTQKLVANASWPQYLGLHYQPKIFELPALTQTSWHWQASKATLAQIQQAGGRIQRLNEQTNCDLLMNLVINNSQNRFLVEHFQHSLMGLEIFIPDNVTITAPLKLFVTIEESINSTLTLLLHVGQNSQLSLQIQCSYGSRVQHVSVVVAGEIANNSHIRLTNVWQSLQTLNLSFIGNLTASADSQCAWTLIPHNRGQMLGQADIDLKAAGSQAELNVLRIAGKDTTVNLQGCINHQAPHTTSHINMRGVLMDNSQINFTSIGKIAHGAHGANVTQESRLMTLGKQALGSVNPLLLIDENDVQAGHAASVGRYNEEQLYYLLSRGLTMAQAQQILVLNFINPIFKDIDRSLQQEVLQYFIQASTEV